MSRSALRRFLFAAVVLAVAYLLAWPVPIRPVAWKAPRAPALAGPYAPNDRLARVEWLGRDVAMGPESTAIDGQGRVYTGTQDGRILRLDPAQGTFEEVARTRGRPLGLAFDAAGLLMVADAQRGLLAVDVRNGKIATLSTSQGGVPFHFPDDVTVASDGTVYFTDASSHFGLPETRDAILEHAGDGRLLAYHPATGATELLLSGLQFANGVALSGDERYLLVDETGAYRITRYWLAGPKKGTAEPFFENLPGLPDNITWSKDRKIFWVALYSPRVPALDALSGLPILRKVAVRLPLWTQPQPKRRAFVLGIDEEGRVVENLQDPSPEGYAPITSAREHAGVLYLGSLEREALGRVAAPPLR